MAGDGPGKRATPAETVALIAAVSRRVGWAREALASDDYSGMEKVWMRRYEIDVPALVDALEEALATGGLRGETDR